MDKGKIFLIFLCFLNVGACALMVRSGMPTSAHIPNMYSLAPVFSKLQDTIWQKIDNDKEKETYLFFHNKNNQYAFEVLKFGAPLQRYPKDYEYITLGGIFSLIDSTLQANTAVVFEEEPNKFVGYLLKDNQTLIVAGASDGAGVIADLKIQKGTKWGLYEQ